MAEPDGLTLDEVEAKSNRRACHIPRKVFGWEKQTLVLENKVNCDMQSRAGHSVLLDR